MVELTLHRDQSASGDGVSNGDGPLPLFFAPVIGTKTATLTTKAVSAMLPANGFRVPTGSARHAMILPFAFDEETWNHLCANDSTFPGITDDYCYNPETGGVSSGPDNVLEVDLYPSSDPNKPAGNRGTVDIGLGGNSSSDIARQILYGMNSQDMACFPNSEIKASSDAALDLTGDTGISAGFKDELRTIEGQMRAIPIFRYVAGNGNNCVYTIVKFVGVRVVHVKLVGNPKGVIVQPCPFIDENVTYDTSGAPIANDTIFSKPVLIQ